MMHQQQHDMARKQFIINSHAAVGLSAGSFRDRRFCVLFAAGWLIAGSAGSIEGGAVESAEGR